MSVLDVLTKARELLSDPSKWNRKSHFSPNGIVGAIGGGTGTDAYDSVNKILANKGWGTGNLTGFAASPKTTHDDLMNVFSEAIVTQLNKE